MLSYLEGELGRAREPKTRLLGRIIGTFLEEGVRDVPFPQPVPQPDVTISWPGSESELGSVQVFPPEQYNSINWDHIGDDTPFSEVFRGIQYQRRIKGINLARETGLDPAHISRLRTGKRNPPRLPNLLKIAKALKLNETDTRELVGRAGYNPETIIFSK